MSSGETTIVVSGAGVTCCNGTYTLNDAQSERAWTKSSGEYLKPVYDSDWGWVMSDSSAPQATLAATELLAIAVSAAFAITFVHVLHDLLYSFDLPVLQ